MGSSKVIPDELPDRGLTGKHIVVMHLLNFSWPLNNMGVHCTGPLILGFFFNKLMVSPLYPPFHIHGFNQPWVKTSIFSVVGKTWMQRATVCMHCSVLYKELEYPRFWCPQGVLESIL